MGLGPGFYELAERLDLRELSRALFGFDERPELRFGCRLIALDAIKTEDLLGLAVVKRQKRA
jgi:hypothetical protein